MKTYISKSCRRAILASRMIRSSEQIEQIKAAIDDPVNAELVKQLDSYIGDEYKEILVEARKQRSEKANAKRAEREADNAPESMDDTAADSPVGGIGLGRTGAPSRFSSRPMPDMDTPDLPGDFADTESETESEPEVDSATAVSGKAIKASFDLNSPKFAETAIEIKGYLNANSSTAGASRIGVKDNELWIYFEDSINLNNVMSAVIEYMSNPYPYLAFNRLARSDNAIVFEIDFINSGNEDDAE